MVIVCQALGTPLAHLAQNRRLETFIDSRRKKTPTSGGYQEKKKRVILSSVLRIPYQYIHVEI